MVHKINIWVLTLHRWVRIPTSISDHQQRNSSFNLKRGKWRGCSFSIWSNRAKMNQFILHNHTAMKWKIGMKFVFYVHISTSGWKPFQFAHLFQDICWPKPPPHRNLVVGRKFSNSPIKPICLISFFAVVLSVNRSLSPPWTWSVLVELQRHCVWHKSCWHGELNARP